MRPFSDPAHALGPLDLEDPARLITAAGDVTLILDDSGVIRDLAFGGEELPLHNHEQWRGQSWSDTVTVETRPKVEALLRDAAARAAPRWRQLNHPATQGADVPVLYSAIQVGSKGKVVAVGRDLRAMSVLQQRLVDAQQSIERDYWRLRHVETRYRLLFEMAAEAVMIVDAHTQKVVEANPAAARLLGGSDQRIVGRVFPDQGFDESGKLAVQTLLVKVRGAGRAEDVQVRSADGKRTFRVAASLVRQETSSLFLVRLAPVSTDLESAPLGLEQSLVLQAVDRASDGFVVTDLDGRVLYANPAFLDLAQLASEEQVAHESLERWLGASGVDFNVLMANVRQHGAVRLFATGLRGEHGAAAEVEVSVVAVPQAEEPCLGFAIRNVGRRLPPAKTTAAGRALPRSVEQMIEMVGRVPLKELVQDTTDLIERLCIEAALELANDNRASAAEMLGLSRQSLYVKLRRYGLGDLGSDSDK